MTAPARKVYAKRRTAVDCLTAGVAIACLLTQASGLLHGLLVEHARCPEHGEAVHVGETGHAAHASAIPGATAALHAAAARVEAHAHEHCALASDRRERAIAGRPSTTATAAPRAVARAVPLLSLAHPAQIPLLSLAPKSSPPA